MLPVWLEYATYRIMLDLVVGDRVYFLRPIVQYYCLVSRSPSLDCEFGALMRVKLYVTV